MAGFLYFVPGRDAIAPEDLQVLGLGYLVDRARPLVPRPLFGNGPDGKQSGLILALADAVPDLGFYPQRQVWKPIPGSPAGVMVGMERDAPLPAPGDLERSRMLSGHWVELADGQEWLAPIARCWLEHGGDAGWVCALPCRSRLDESGHWASGDPLPRYEAVWDLAARWDGANQAAIADREEGGEEVSVSFQFDDLHEGAVLALQQNYLLGPAEVDMIGCLTQDDAARVLNALVDLPTRLEWVKKKLAAESAGGSSSPGPAAAPRATGPA